MKPYNKEKEWVHFLTRPTTLLGASLWSSWYESPEFSKVFKVSQDFLFIEQPKGIVRAYRVKKQLDALWDKAEEIAKQPARCKKLFLKGQAYNKKAEEVLRKKSITDLRKAVEFFWNVAIYSTTIPYLTYAKLNEINCKDEELMKLGEHLRTKSLYPMLIDKIITPLAMKKIERADLLTISEIFAGKTEVPKERMRTDKLFVYQSISRKETIAWTDDNENIVNELEPVAKENEKIKGQVACSGKVKGIARVILKMNEKAETFNEGDILVTICSSPDFMPVLSKAGAIVTDEGGITCHAAVISRELNIPCIIGTRTATRILKDGDMVEVDANNGTVKKLLQ
jgi:phosphohistidine swiveling domain-containing protein